MAARVDAAGQGHALDAWVINDLVALLVRDQQVGVSPCRRTRIEQQFFEGDGALRHTTSVFDNQRIASHQLGPGHAGELVVGEIPGLNAQQHAHRAAFHVRLPDLGVQLGRRQKKLGIVGVNGQDVGAELHLATCLVDKLAHFQCLQLGKVVHVGLQQCGRPVDDGGALGVALVCPGLKAGLGRGQCGFQLSVTQQFKIFEYLAVVAVDALISHGDFLVGTALMRRDLSDVRRCVSNAVASINHAFFSVARLSVAKRSAQTACVTLPSCHAFCGSNQGTSGVERQKLREAKSLQVKSVP